MSLIPHPPFRDPLPMSRAYRRILLSQRYTTAAGKSDSRNAKFRRFLLLLSVAKVNESFWNGLLLQKGISWCLSTDRRFHRSLHPKTSLRLPCALSVANQLCFATKGAQRGTKVFRVGAPPQTTQTHCRRQPKTSLRPPCPPCGGN